MRHTPLARLFAQRHASPLALLVLAGCGEAGFLDSLGGADQETASPVDLSSPAPEAAPTARLAVVFGTGTDADGDGYYTSVDCNDASAAVNPGATEADNLVDDDCDGYVDEPFVNAGDLVITEINRQSRLGSAAINPKGSWIEVYNASGRTVDMANWTLSRGISSRFNSIQLDPAVAPVLSPGSLAVICAVNDYESSATAAYPLHCDYYWQDETQASTYRGTYHDNTFALRRDSDRVALYVDGSRTTGRLVDQVTWYWDATNGYWPRDQRFSMSLDPAYWSASQNDSVSVWCSTNANSSGAVSNSAVWRWYDNAGTLADEHGTPRAANYNCPNDPDVDGDGYAGTADCNDTNAAINPGAAEVCDGVDNNCNGSVDETGGTTFYADADGDGYGNAASSSTACSAPAGYVTTSTDCNDGSAAINPAAAEVCDGVDNNCNGSIDETGAATTYYPDADGDGYGSASGAVSACTAPSGYVTTSTDCNDGSAAVNPGATEVCDGVDNNCNGATDESGTSTTWYLDTDGDGYGTTAGTVSACSAPAGYAGNSSDCNDSNAAINPGATEVCDDGIDNDCDPATDCAWGGSQKVSDNYDFRAYGDVVSQAVGSAIADNGDFNGDGYDDVVVGQSYYDVSSVSDVGRAYVFYGPVNAGQTPDGSDLKIDGDPTVSSDWFGSATLFAHDTDGHDDLLISGYLAGSTNIGGVWLFDGGASPTSYTDASASFSDSSANASVGWSLATGDMDGDGRDDVAIGAIGRSSNAGAFGVWDRTAVGGAETLTGTSTFSVTSSTANANLGYALSMADDLDGDGADDLIATAPATASTTTPGAAYLFYGVDGLAGALTTSAADATITGTTNGDRFGMAAAMLGDTNGDGQVDFVVTADKSDLSAADAGAAYVYTSAPSGSVAAASAATILTGEAAGDFYGRSAARVLDIDGDGNDDMLLGATSWDLGTITNTGASYLYFGPFPAGTSSGGSFDARFTGSNYSDAVGYAVAGGGDVNGDGRADFMISATSWDSYGLLNAGGAWLYYGHAN